MKNVTISLSNDLLDAGRRYAEAHQISLNSLIRQLLAQAVMPPSEEWPSDCFALMDKAAANSRGRRWEREDLHRLA